MSEAVRDRAQRARLDRSIGHALSVRADRMAERPDWDDLRERAAGMRRHSLGRLAELLEEFQAAAEASGARVHFAETGAEARALLLGLIGDPGEPLVKSKSMVTEEIGLRSALEEAGVALVETDLGEYIVQLSRTTPSHIVAPVIHLSAENIAEVFRRELGMSLPPDVDPRTISLAAREHMRPFFVDAKVGMVGANILTAREGAVVTCTNEGNAGLGTTIPERLIVVAGIEKLCPNLADTAAPLQLLGSSSTGQRLTCYTHVLRAGMGGPSELDIVLLDAGRTALLADDDLWDALACIRCGACMHVCPIYRRTGGQAYGWIYPGPIGIILSAFLESPMATKMADACSLCGACAEVCPVKIDLPEGVRLVRERAIERSPAARTASTVGGRVFASPSLWRLGGELARAILSRGDAVGPLKAWSDARELPTSPHETLGDASKGAASDE
jgi:L-lactate dehydrogenase complex protein LldF